jgi:small-conductance mechanosensitive channel
VQYIDLGRSLEESLEAEKEHITQLKERLDRVRRLEKTVQTELDRYKLQLSSHINMLLLTTVPIDELEKARAELESSLHGVSQRLEELSGKLDAIEELLTRTDEQNSLNQKQLAEMKGQAPETATTEKLLKQLRVLRDLLGEKKRLLQDIQHIYTTQIAQLRETRQALAALLERFTREIKERKRESLLQRRADPLAVLGWKRIQREVETLATHIGLLVSIDFWWQETRSLWQSGPFSFVVSLLLFMVIQIFLFRLQRFCAALRERPSWSRYPWRSFTVELVRRSLPLIGATVFFYAYAHHGRLPASQSSLLRLTYHILIIWLLTRWGLQVPDLWNKYRDASIPACLVSRMRRLLISLRFFSIAYVLSRWAVGGGSAILFLGRLPFEIGLLLWCAAFWKAFRRESTRATLVASPAFKTLKPFMIGSSYTVAGGGLVLELAGYGQMALYWYASWARTAAVLLWAGLTFFVLREIHLTNGTAQQPGQNRHLGPPVRWLLLRLGWLVWLGTLMVCLLLCWGAKQAIIVGFFGILNRPVSLGQLRFSLLGFVYALLILMLTHVAARLWRGILKARILKDSGLESGVQESIVTISVYLLWIFGILLSLHTLGLSTTSLAVAFGALGIGLGFGLQNIFNNFISGLILLFERPIQIGDVVEINGIWGTVMKINVRSTQVQSFDNASLIIPNSEFISSQLTNWSFKDLRLRRHITVGVAYGSDVELVRNTLLEIAHAHPRVFKDPEPDVLFVDFGDSALVFRLRVWTTIAYCLSAETDIRFEIDRLFRERNIQIPFPQRDLHLRSGLEKMQIPELSADQNEQPESMVFSEDD